MTSDITLTETTVTTITGSTVSGLQNNPVSAATPTIDQILEWNGSQWTPTDLPSSLPPDGYAGGDLGENYPNPFVVALQGNAVNSETLGVNQDGYVLTWNNTDGYWAAQPNVKAVCGVYSSSTQTLPTNTPTKITNWTVKFDNTDSFNISNSDFVAPVSAYYQISAQLIASGTLSTSAGFGLSVYVNGSGTNDNGLSLVGSSDQVQVALSTVVYAEAGQTIDLRAGVGGTNSLTILAYTSDNYLNIHQI